MPALPLPVAAAPPRPRQPGISLRRTLAYAALIGVPFALVYGLGLYALTRWLP
jgi:hypothetical protein